MVDTISNEFFTSADNILQIPLHAGIKAVTIVRNKSAPVGGNVIYLMTNIEAILFLEIPRERGDGLKISNLLTLLQQAEIQFFGGAYL